MPLRMRYGGKLCDDCGDAGIHSYAQAQGRSEVFALVESNPEG